MSERSSTCFPESLREGSSGPFWNTGIPPFLRVIDLLALGGEEAREGEGRLREIG